MNVMASTVVSQCAMAATVRISMVVIPVAVCLDSQGMEESVVPAACVSVTKRSGLYHTHMMVETLNACGVLSSVDIEL